MFVYGDVRLIAIEKSFTFTPVYGRGKSSMWSHQVLGTWYQVPGTKYLVPSAWYQALGTKRLGTKYLVPSTWYH